jgi:hypothetical protein
LLRHRGWLSANHQTRHERQATNPWEHEQDMQAEHHTS